MAVERSTSTVFDDSSNRSIDSVGESSSTASNAHGIESTSDARRHLAAVDAPSTVPPPLRARPLTDAGKRAFDIAAASLMLLATLPLLPLIAAAVYLESPGPVFFRQTRLGRGRREFGMLKFRSMRTDAEAILHADPELYATFRANGYKFPEGEDPRITRVGAVLRATSLDELPQLINVLKGDMSLVGPRPPVIDQIEDLYGEHDQYYFSVRPGLTGLWQVSGRSDLCSEDRCALDIEYVTTRSVRKDVRILIATVPAVLRQSGAH